MASLAASGWRKVSKTVSISSRAKATIPGLPADMVDESGAPLSAENAIHKGVDIVVEQFRDGWGIVLADVVRKVTSLLRESCDALVVQQVRSEMESGMGAVGPLLAQRALKVVGEFGAEKVVAVQEADKDKAKEEELTHKLDQARKVFELKQRRLNKQLTEQIAMVKKLSSGGGVYCTSVEQHGIRVIEEGWPLRLREAQDERDKQRERAKSLKDDYDAARKDLATFRLKCLDQERTIADLEERLRVAEIELKATKYDLHYRTVSLASSKLAMAQKLKQKILAARAHGVHKKHIIRKLEKQLIAVQRDLQRITGSDDPIYTPLSEDDLQVAAEFVPKLTLTDDEKDRIESDDYTGSDDEDDEDGDIYVPPPRMFAPAATMAVMGRRDSIIMLGGITQMVRELAEDGSKPASPSKRTAPPRSSSGDSLPAPAADRPDSTTVLPLPADRSSPLGSLVVDVPGTGRRSDCSSDGHSSTAGLDGAGSLAAVRSPPGSRRSSIESLPAEPLSTPRVESERPIQPSTVFLDRVREAIAEGEAAPPVTPVRVITPRERREEDSRLPGRRPASAPACRIIRASPGGGTGRKPKKGSTQRPASIKPERVYAVTTGEWRGGRYEWRSLGLYNQCRRPVRLTTDRQRRRRRAASASGRRGRPTARQRGRSPSRSRSRSRSRSPSPTRSASRSASPVRPPRPLSRDGSVRLSTSSGSMRTLLPGDYTALLRPTSSSSSRSLASRPKTASSIRSAPSLLRRAAFKGSMPTSRIGEAYARTEPGGDDVTEPVLEIRPSRSSSSLHGVKPVEVRDVAHLGDVTKRIDSALRGGHFRVGRKKYIRLQQAPSRSGQARPVSGKRRAKRMDGRG